MRTKIERVVKLLSRVQVDFLGQSFVVRIQHDVDDAWTAMHEPRVFIQFVYTAPNTKTGEIVTWKGGKWYLSEFMTDDEIIKKAYLAFRTCIEHEVLESFKVDNIVLFNPHVDFEELLKVSHKEVKRKEL